VSDAPPRSSASRSALGGIVAAGISSATNFVAVVFAARNGSPASFGAVSLGFTAYLLAQSVTRALVGEMLLIGSDPHDHRATRLGVTATIVTALPIAAVIAIIGLAMPSDGPTQPVMFVLAACIVPLCVLDTFRYVAFSRSTPLRAAGIDLAWAACFVIGLLAFGGELTSFDVWVAWCVGGAIVGVGGTAATRALCAPGSATAWMRENLTTSGRYIIENVTSQSVNGIALFALGALAGTAAVGAVRGVSTLFGPLTVLYSGVYAGLLSRLRQHESNRARILRVVSLGLVGAALSATVFWLVVPTGFGTALLGDTWASARALVVPFGIGTAITVAAGGALIGLRMLVAASTTLRIRLICAPITLALLVAGSAWSAQQGYAIGFVISSVIATGLLWFGYRQVQRNGAPEPAPDPAT